MRVIEVMNGVTGYALLVDYVMSRGKRRTPRGLATLDAGPITIVMHDVTHSLPLGVGRGVSRRVAAVEAVQLIGAFSDPQLTVAASPNFTRFLEPNHRFYGAYGQRIRDQLPVTLHKLRLDKDSRQAVITLWDPWLDNQPSHLDYPCTVALNLAIVDDRLDLNVVMRSQDVWLGTPYDWFQFTQLQQTAARILKIEPGLYRHTTWSTHIYGTNFDDVEKLTDAPPKDKREWQPDGIGRVDDTVRQVMTRAASLAHVALEDITESEKWYREQLSPLVG